MAKMISTPWQQNLGIPPISQQAAGQGTYLGSTYSYTPGHAATTPGGLGTSGAATVGADDTFVEGTDVYAMWMNLPPAQMDRLQAVANYVHPKGATYTQIGDLWSKGVALSHNATRLQGQRLTPLNALEQMVLSGNIDGIKGTAGGGAGGGGAGAYKGPVTTTSDATSSRLTNPSSARGIMNSALQTYLGRDAMPQEQQAFLAALNAEESANPTMTHQVVTTTPVGHNQTVKQADQTTGGVDQTQFAEEWARAQPGSAEYQAAGRYMDLFVKSLQATV